jgi:hypothetical protein
MFKLRLVLALGLLFTSAALAKASDPEARVRVSHPRLARLLEAGEGRSATLRDLVARLQLSDVIVHLEGAPPGHPIAGGMQFVGAVALTRYVRVTVRADLPAEALMALIGHELRHAVEVAENPEIRDEPSFRNYYQEWGRPSHRGRTVTYDTRAAVEAGQRVAVELRLTHAFRSETR